MANFSLHGLTDNSTEVKALKRELEKSSGQIVAVVQLDPKMKKLDDEITRGVNLFFENGQSLYIVYRKNGDSIKVKLNGKDYPLGVSLNYEQRQIFNQGCKELGEVIRKNQPRFDKLQERKKVKLVENGGQAVKSAKERALSVTAEIKQLIEQSSSLDASIEQKQKEIDLLTQQVEQLKSQHITVGSA